VGGYVQQVPGERHMVRCHGSDVLNNCSRNCGIVQFVTVQFPGKRAHNAFERKVFPGSGFGQGA
jgi:hypothetical protein